MESGLKRKILIAASAGAGAVLMTAIIAGVLLWYASRPKPPALWNNTAIQVNEPPGFGPSSDGSEISLTYIVENTTDADYELRDKEQFRMMVKLRDGTWVGPTTSSDIFKVSLPLFIPAKQRARLDFSISSPGQVQLPTETDTDYHERLRAYLEKHLSEIGSFGIFDDVNHYQIDLPRWLNKPSTKP
jgi:hypothetical protein